MKSPRPSVPEPEPASPVQVPLLDAGLSNLLTEIQNENVPERLLMLAWKLQAALAERDQQNTPN